MRPPRASTVVGFRSDHDAVAARSLWTEDAFEIADEIEVTLRRCKALIGLGRPLKAAGQLLILRNQASILEVQLLRWKDELAHANSGN